MSPERKAPSRGAASSSAPKAPARAGGSAGRSGGGSGGATGGGRGGKPTAKTGGGGSGDGVKRPLLRRVLTWLLLAFLGFLVLGAVAFAYLYTTTDIPDPNKDFTSQTTFVYYADGKTEVGRFASQNRTSVALSDVPQHVQDAVIAAEDRSFYTNKGIDPKGILRAAFSNARGNTTQGASTITQQYVKVLYLSQERTFSRKLKEAFVSLKLQRQKSKDEILQGYLNTIYFGRGAYGVQAASQAYFDKDVKELTIPEGAMLAAVLNSPTNLDPASGSAARQRLLGRYQYVLPGWRPPATSPPSRPTASSSGCRGCRRSRTRTSTAARRATSCRWCKELLAQGFSDQEISGGGLKVTTTFTKNAMHAAAQAVRGPEAEGAQAAARRGRPPSTPPPARCGACTPARTTSRASSTGPSPEAPPGRRSSPSRSRPASTTATR